MKLSLFDFLCMYPDRVVPSYVVFLLANDRGWAFDLVDLTEPPVTSDANNRLSFNFLTHVVCVQCNQPREVAEDLVARRARVISAAPSSQFDERVRRVAAVNVTRKKWSGFKSTAIHYTDTLRTGVITFSLAKGGPYIFNRSDLRWINLLSLHTLELGFTRERVILHGWGLDGFTNGLLIDGGAIQASQGVQRHLPRQRFGLERIERHAYPRQ